MTDPVLRQLVTYAEELQAEVEQVNVLLLPRTVEGFFVERPWWRRLSLSIAFVPRDLWIGLYIGPVRGAYGAYRDFFVCIVPTLPLRVRFWAR